MLGVITWHDLVEVFLAGALVGMFLPFIAGWIALKIERS